MSENEKPNPAPRAGSGRNAWMEALEELESIGSTAKVTPVPKSSAPPRSAITTPAPAPAGRPVPVTDALQDICAKLGKAQGVLTDFVTAHPYLIAPNVYRMWEENMKETSVTIERQINNLRPREEPTGLDR